MSAQNSHMVALRDVTMEFEDKKVLDDLSLTVEPQERLVVMGQSGSGKSTILRLILGILKPNDGEVFFKQFEVTRLKRRKLQQVRRQIGMVYQVLGAAQLTKRARQRRLAAGGVDRQIAQGDRQNCR